MTEPADVLTIAPAIAAGDPAPEVSSELRRNMGRLASEDPEAALACLDATLAGDQVAEALRWLHTSGALGVWLPEVSALVGFHESSPSHHKDLWSHTIEVIERTPTEGDLRWLALTHDIGKVATRAIDGRGHVTFYGHERLGAQLMIGIAARLKMPHIRAERIAFMVEHHARVNAYEPGWTDRAVRRLIREAGDHLDDMVRFSGADYTTRRRGRAARIRAHLADLKRRLATLQEADRAPRILPARLGRALCSGLDLEPGPHIGEAIAWLEAEIAAGRLEAGQGVEAYIEAVRDRSRSQPA